MAPSKTSSRLALPTSKSISFPPPADLRAESLISSTISRGLFRKLHSHSVCLDRITFLRDLLFLTVPSIRYKISPSSSLELPSSTDKLTEEREMEKAEKHKESSCCMALEKSEREKKDSSMHEIFAFGVHVRVCVRASEKGDFFLLRTSAIFVLFFFLHSFFNPSFCPGCSGG